MIPGGIHVLGAGRFARERGSASCANGTRIDGWVVDVEQQPAAGGRRSDRRRRALTSSSAARGVSACWGWTAASRIRCHTLVPYGTMLRDWRLDSSDVIAGAGRLVPGMIRPVLLLTKP